MWSAILNTILNKIDSELYDATLFTLGTTNGGLIATSTPWSLDHIFYKMYNDAAYSDFKRIHVDWKRALGPNGPLKKNILEKIRRQLEADPWRWRREMEAQWAEDELTFHSQQLITQCIDSELAPMTDDWTKKVNAPIGRYFIGVDLGKKVDYSVIAIVRYDTKEEHAELGMIQFPLDTPYASVIGMVKVICDKLQRVEKVLVDRTGVGEYITEEMKGAKIRSTVEGIMLTVPSKQEILGYMKNLMQTRALSLYYDRELIAEINVERYELMKTGQIHFGHPEGTHDDRLFALALAVYATRTPDTSFMTVVYGVPHQ
jgi:phage FluMu gp28-like protein